MFFTIFRKRRATANAAASTSSPERESDNELPPPYRLNEYCPPTDYRHRNTHTPSQSPTIHPYKLNPQQTFRLTHFMATAETLHQDQAIDLQIELKEKVQELTERHHAFKREALEMPYRLADEGLEFDDIMDRLESLNREKLEGATGRKEG